MVKSLDYDVIVGSKLDEQFGPVMVFGMGGIMAEIHRDTALALPPLKQLSKDMLVRLKRCLAFAHKSGLKRVYGLVLSENRQMLSLGKKLGFKRTVTPGTGEIELEIDMDAWN